MNIAVTGGAGFIGGHLVEACLGAGHRVIVLDDLSTGARSNIPEAAELIVGDVTDLDSVMTALASTDVVFHLAAVRAVLRSVEDPLVTDRVNVGGTLNVLKAAVDQRVRRVVVISSSSIYGGIAPRPTPESATLHPRSPYAVSKAAADWYTRVFADLYPIETVVLRLFNVFGPRQRPDDPYAGVIPLFMSALQDGSSPQVHGDGLQSRDFTYVADVVGAALLAATAPGETVSGRAFNIARGSETTLLEMLRTLGDLFGVDPNPTFTHPRPGDVRHSRADISAAHLDLGYSPKTNITTGLARTVEWFRQSSNRPEPVG